jgi:hypothetical protein
MPRLPQNLTDNNGPLEGIPGFPKRSSAGVMPASETKKELKMTTENSSEKPPFEVNVPADPKASTFIPANGGEHVPEHLKSRAAADKPGRGYSEEPDDAIYPLALVLQANSPVCNKRSPSYVANAEAGRFYFRTLPNPIRDGEKGIIVIPWHTDEVWREWKPNRGGFVCTRFVAPTAAEVDRAINRSKVMLVNGNECILTKQVFFLFEGKPFEMPLTSTKNEALRELKMMFRNSVDNTTNEILSIYAHHYLLQTIPESNDKGDWFGVRFKKADWVSTDEYDLAQKLAETMEAEKELRAKQLSQAQV